MYLTQEDFDKHILNIKRSQYLPVDTEGELNHPFARTWGLSTSANSVPEYFAFQHVVGRNLPESWLPRMKEAIESHPCLIFHNAKHDLRALQALGINYTGKFYDTMLMAHFVDENIYSKELDYLSKMYGGDPKRRSEEMSLFIKAFGWALVPIEYLRPYGANDAYITGELFHELYPDFVNQGFDGTLWDVEQKFIRLMGKIENTGIPIDRDLCERELVRGLGIMNEIQTSLGFNPASPIELGKFFLEEMNLPVMKRTKKGKPSFNKDAMEMYDEYLQLSGDKRAEQILTFRGWQKTTSSNYKRYLEKVHPDGRLRPNYKLHGTHTGRLSCEDPNLQQIPRESEKDWNGHLKLAFISSPGYTAYDADFSQLELRLGAAVGRVERLIEVFNDDDRDIFTEMSKDLGMSRNNTKTLNYTLQFGGGATRIKNVFDVKEHTAKAIIGNYFRQYPGLAKASQLAKYRAEQNGFIKYWTGRRRHFADKYEESRKAFNSWCQGGAFEIVKRRMIACDEAGLNNDECRMDLQVHDSVRFEIMNGKEHIYLPEIKRTMEDVEADFKFGVNFRVKIKKWGE